ncbi:MAG: DNA-directed DNA polymerase [Halobacteriota archaeon]|nr:DNA-directed DNA polymerase [Halobacteriota archaeon]
MIRLNTTLDMFFGDKVDDGKIKLGVLQVEYSVIEDEPVIHVFGRTEDGVLRRIDVHGFRPYFYTPKELATGYEDPRVTEIDDGFRSIGGRNLSKIYAKTPADVKETRGRFREHFEADILFPTRFMIDMGITSGVLVPDKPNIDVSEIEPTECNTPLRTCILDIECDDRIGFPDPNRDPIYCITVWDSFERSYTTFIWSQETTEPVSEECVMYKTERDMLYGFMDYIHEKDPDLLTGWNFTNFDAPYIINRMNAIGIRPSKLSRLGTVWTKKSQFETPTIKGRIAFDLLYGYKKTHFSEKESYRLDSIAEEELGERKVRFSGKIGDLWENDIEKLVEYNRKDVELCVGINDKVDITGFFREVASFAGCPLEDTLNSSRVIDVYVLRKARDLFVLPSKGNEKQDEFEGAMVLDPIKGVRDNVIVLDLMSLYPMAMMTLNASPETKSKDGELVAPNGVRFKKEPDGLTRMILKELLDARGEKKSLRDNYDYGSVEYKKFDLQQYAIKVITNSYYGVSGYSRFRLYDREIGSATTSVGRAIIQHTRDFIESMGYEVVYGDTDSCMIAVGKKDLEETIKIGRKIESDLNKRYDDFAMSLNADEHWFKIKFEKVFERFFQAGSKKRYAGKLIWKEGKSCNEIDITGFEFRRSDYPRITKKVQEEVLSRIISGEGFKEIGDFLRGVASDFEKKSLQMEDIGIPCGIGKELKHYDTDDAHIRGAQYANDNFGTNFGKGSKPKRIYVSRVPDGYWNTDVICFEYQDQVPIGFEPDWDTMLEKVIRSPIERILEAMGWSWSEVINNQRQMALF